MVPPLEYPPDGPPYPPPYPPPKFPHPFSKPGTPNPPPGPKKPLPGSVPLPTPLLLGSVVGFPLTALSSGVKESAGRAAKEKVVVVVSKRSKRKEVARLFMLGFFVGLPC